MKKPSLEDLIEASKRTQQTRFFQEKCFSCACSEKEEFKRYYYQTNGCSPFLFNFCERHYLLYSSSCYRLTEKELFLVRVHS